MHQSWPSSPEPTSSDESPLGEWRFSHGGTRYTALFDPETHTLRALVGEPSVR